LKQGNIGKLNTISGSRPSRARGLKQLYHFAGFKFQWVAPLAGAWIETLKRMRISTSARVAPLAGAWIETAWWQR